jgi:3-oxoacyl-[acyl-carrier protein] reductase
LSAKSHSSPGASKGIGAAIAKALAAEGAAVVINYSSSKAGAGKVVDEITKAGGKAVAVQADVARKADIERLFADARNAFGRLDILVNNAGIYEFAPLENITEEHFHKQFNLNVLGLILATQAAVKLFEPTGGNIINISSLVSTSGFPKRHRLQRHQRSGGRAHARPRQRTWAAQDSGQCHKSRNGGNRGSPCLGNCRKRHA